MKNILSIIVALLVLGALQWTGVFARLNLSHPWWGMKATLTGAAIGAALTLVIMWAISRKPATASTFGMLAIVLLAISAAVTIYGATTFINAEEFEPLAAQFWFLGYNSFAAIFVPVVSLAVRKMLIGRNG